MLRAMNDARVFSDSRKNVGKQTIRKQQTQKQHRNKTVGKLTKLGTNEKTNYV